MRREDETWTTEAKRFGEHGRVEDVSRKALLPGDRRTLLTERNVVEERLEMQEACMR